jgi:septation ring formation regulator EzrA
MDEDVNRKMDFIVEQQAQLAGDLQKLAESHAKAEERISNLEGAMVGVVGIIGDVVKAQKELVKNQQELAEARKVPDQKLAELGERVDAFIVTVERYLGNRGGEGGDQR